jgi:demethylmenaquinone methyltransferase/2-methoxy-6-polyprenyl-1,4-benzoquinol methylase
MEPKNKRVVPFFDSIAPHYDLVNRIASLGIDNRWRSRGIELLWEELEKKGESKIVDIATGTGKMVEILHRLAEKRGKKVEIFGVDPSRKMLEIAQKRYPFAQFRQGVGEALPFPSNFADGVTLAFGLRNFSDRKKGIEEIGRVLKPGGVVMILEFVKGRGNLRKIVDFYTAQIVPLVGSLFSGNREAYSYLSSSIQHFYTAPQLAKMVEGEGFELLHNFTSNFGQVLTLLARKKEK